MLLSFIVGLTVINSFFLFFNKSEVDINFDVLLKPIFLLLYNANLRRTLIVFAKCLKSAVPILIVWIFNAVVFLSLARILFQEWIFADNFFLNLP